MDGKALLLLFAALAGGGYYLTQNPAILSGDGGGAVDERVIADVIDLRHNNIRQDLRRDGYDLDDPASFVFERDGELVVGGPVAATEHLRPVFTKEIMRGHRPPRATEIPASTRKVNPQAMCGFTPPAPGSRIGNVFANATLQTSNVFAFSAAEFEDNAQRYLADVKANGMPEKPGLSDMFNAAGTLGATQLNSSKLADQVRFMVMDVAVTETAAPVHLVLQGGVGRILWNVHLAEGATLSGVTLLGGDHVALANAPLKVPVEIMTNAEMKRCGAIRARKPLETAPIFTAVDRGELSEADARAELVIIADKVETWNSWFQGQFGVRSDETVIGYDTASLLALVGPLPQSPEARLPYHGLKGAVLRISPVDRVVLNQSHKAERAVRKAIEERAKALAGGDLAAVAGQGS